MQNYLQNAELLVETIGKFPTFHDAEVLEISLKRSAAEKLSPPRLETTIRIIEIEAQTSEEKSVYIYHQFDVQLSFTNIFGVKIENFNHQNVIDDVVVKEVESEDFRRFEGDDRLLGVVSDEEINRLKLSVKFEYCFGVEAKFLCDSIIVESVVAVAK